MDRRGSFSTSGSGRGFNQSLRGFNSSRGLHSSRGFDSSRGFNSRSGNNSSGSYRPPGEVSPFNDIKLKEIIIPAKESPQLQINSYGIKDSGNTIFEYILKFVMIDRYDRPIDLSERLKRSVEERFRIQKTSKLYYELLNKFEEFRFYDKMDGESKKWRHVYAYDRGSKFFCSLSLDDRNNNNPFVLTREDIGDELFFKLRSPKNIFATLERVIAIMPTDTALRAVYLDILFSQHMYDNYENFVKFGPKYFHLVENIDNNINNGDTLKNGLHKTIRTKNNVNDLQIDAKFSPFRNTQPLHEYINEKWRFDFDMDWFSNEIYTKLLELRGVYVRTNYKHREEVFRINGFTTVSANMFTFEKDGVNTLVHNYIYDRYEKELAYPKLPCVIKKVRNQFMYYPVELLDIFMGQRVPKSELLPTQEKEMIRKSCRLPLTLIRDIDNHTQIAGINENEPNILPANIRISRSMNHIDSEVLKPPEITYKNGEPKLIDMGQWNANEDYFVKPVTISSLLIIYETKWVKENDANGFVNKIRQFAALKFGMRIERLEYVPFTVTENMLPELADFITTHRNDMNCDFVMAFARGSNFHHFLKATEVVTKIPTQQIDPNIVCDKNFRSNTLGNIIRKMNLKKGGCNQNLSQASPVLINGNNIDIFRSFLDDTMIMGFALSHPPNGMLHEPSVCGYSFSTSRTGNVTRGGFVYILNGQKDLTEIDLGVPLEKAAKLYYEENKKYPKRVLIYRFGASEGEIRKSLSNEYVAIEKVLCRVMNKENVKIDVVLVSRQHNTRIFKKKEEIRGKKAPEQNVTPGSCIDGVNDGEFIMVPHKTLQGTAKPTLFFHLFHNSDENDLSLNFLKNITHAFCYMHEIVNSAISVPHVVRSAEQMAVRGRNNRFMMGDQLNVVDANNYLSHLTNNLNPDIPTRYWA